MAVPIDWNKFLKEYADVSGQAEWPGNPGASEEQLTDAEERLKATSALLSRILNCHQWAAKHLRISSCFAPRKQVEVRELISWEVQDVGESS